MSDLDTNGTITVLKHTLLSTCQDLFTQYQQLMMTQGASDQNTRVLKSSIVDLKNELKEATATTDTLNAEVTDRSTARKPTTLQRWGVSTQQDWVLLVFFASYALLSLVGLSYVAMYSAKKMHGLGVTSLCLVAVGYTIGIVIKQVA